MGLDIALLGLGVVSTLAGGYSRYQTEQAQQAATVQAATFNAQQDEARATRESELAAFNAGQTVLQAEQVHIEGERAVREGRIAFERAQGKALVAGGVAGGQQLSFLDVLTANSERASRMELETMQDAAVKEQQLRAKADMELRQGQGQVDSLLDRAGQYRAQAGNARGGSALGALAGTTASLVTGYYTVKPHLKSSESPF